MSNPSGLPLFNRIVVATTCGGLLLGILVGLATPEFRDALDVVNGFLLVTFAAFAAGGLWLSVTWRDRSQAELAEENSRDQFDRPEICENARVYHFPVMSKAGAIYIDEDSGQIHFRNCHVPRRFIASEQEWFSCPFSDIKGVHHFRYRGESVTVVTSQGKVLIPDYGRDFVELREHLTRVAPDPVPGFSADHPMMGLAYLGGVLTGLFGGVALTPRNAPDSTLGLYVLGGSFLGVAAVQALVVFSDRQLKIGLAQPLGFAVVGICAGVSIVELIGPVVGWRMSVTVGIVTVCGICGAGIGIWKQLRTRNRE